jgi:tRNA G18 (ribose-2'-O)-methylase SpoU
MVAKLVRRLYIDQNDAKALYWYERFRDWDPTLPALTIDPAALSSLYHQMIEGIKPDLDTPRILPDVRRLDHVVSDTPFLPYCIYLDQIRSGHNLGSIIRTCEAFRLGSIHLSKNCPKIDHKDVLKTALGAQNHVTIVENSTLEDLPRPWIAIETCAQSADYSTFFYPESRATIILGNEEFGISQEILSQADFFVEIPLCGIKNSLNVANAFAILASMVHLKSRAHLSAKS